MEQKNYKVLYRNYKQYNEETRTYQNHKTVKSTLPVQMLSKIGVNEKDPYIVVEYDETNECLIIKKK